MGPQDPFRRPSLTDAEIGDIAARIARAVAAPRPDDPRDDICAARHELPPKDEDRVIAVIEAWYARG